MARVINPALKATIKTVKYIVLSGDVDALKAKIKKGSIDVNIVKEGGVDLKNLSKKLNDKKQPLTEEFEKESTIDWPAVLDSKKVKEEKKKN